MIERLFTRSLSLSCHLFAVRRQKNWRISDQPTAQRWHQHCYLIISILLHLKPFHFHQSAFQNWPAARMRPLLRCHLEIPKNCQISHGRRRLTEIRAVTWWRRQNSSANRQTKPGGGRDLIGKKTSPHHLPHPHLSEGHRILPVHLVSSDCPS